ncbi:MAG: hypothetical protein K2X47_08840 [Bdellovibrionales bacterium]|nr:hypothetical protein [Bdellovibrionales bacterium]
MKNNILISAMLISLSFLCIDSALAGAEGHGGGAFVCRDSSGNIKPGGLSVEVADLWEGRTMYRLPIWRSDFDWLSQVRNALEKLKLWQPELYEVCDLSLVNYIQEIPYNAAIATPQDFRSHFWKKGCPLEGAASFDDQSHTIYTDPEISARMSPTDYAALIVHEIVYKALREKFGDQNSVRARRITAFLFSDLPVLSPGLHVPKGSFHCQTAQGAAYFSFYLSGDISSPLFQFEWVSGQPVIARTVGTLGGMLSMTLLTQLLSGKIQNLNIAGTALSGKQNLDFRVESEHEKFQITILKDDRFPSFTCKPFEP